MADRSPPRRSWLGFSVFLILIAALLVADRTLDLGTRLDPSVVGHWLSEAGPLAPPAFILVMALAVVVSPIPSLPLDVLAGTVFGPFEGALYAVLGATLGAVASFSIARALGREVLARFLKGHIQFCQHCSNKILTKVVFVSRLIPFVSFDLVSYGAGLTRMSLGRFTIATALGMIPLTFAYTTFGATALGSRTARWVGGSLMVGLLFLLPRWIERYDLFSMRRLIQHEEVEPQEAKEMEADGSGAGSRPVSEVGPDRHPGRSPDSDGQADA